MADPELAFDVKWLPLDTADPRERATFGSLTITAGRDRIPITEVDDAIARTVRPDIRVPIVPLAQWLIVNWWRLRWESRWDAPERLPPAWVRAHSMASISADVPWPALQITSDGAFVYLEARAEHIRDVAAVRYLRDVDLCVPADHFERAIDGFLAGLDERIALCAPGDRDITKLIAELREERSDPGLARACRLQALAGFDPGMAPANWLRRATSLVDEAGTTGDEVAAVVPMLRDGITGASDAIDAMKRSTIDVRLVADVDLSVGAGTELPWQRGRRLAALFRSARGVGAGPVPTKVLEEWLDVQLPLAASPGVKDRGLTGGYRNGSAKGRTRVVITTNRMENQRFYLGRLIGAALVSSPDDHVLPVTNAGTAFQKFERSFAQELFCPWAALDAYTNEHGTDDEGIAAAAAHFGVSELLVASTLVNNNKLGRHRLPSPYAMERTFDFR